MKKKWIVIFEQSLVNFRTLSNEKSIKSTNSEEKSKAFLYDVPKFVLGIIGPK